MSEQEAKDQIRVQLIDMYNTGKDHMFNDLRNDLLTLEGQVEVFTIKDLIDLLDHYKAVYDAS